MTEEELHLVPRSNCEEVAASMECQAGNGAAEVVEYLAPPRIGVPHAYLRTAPPSAFFPYIFKMSLAHFHMMSASTINSYQFTECGLLYGH